MDHAPSNENVGVGLGNCQPDVATRKQLKIIVNGETLVKSLNPSLEYYSDNDEEDDATSGSESEADDGSAREENYDLRNGNAASYPLQPVPNDACSITSSSSAVKTERSNGVLHQHHACSQCPSRFSTKALLVGHYNQHKVQNLMDNGPFTCKECNKNFTSLYHLGVHMIRHSDERPYTCPECNKSFKKVSSLKLHMMSHSREWPFVCTRCSMRFKTELELHDHRHDHASENGFRCGTCGRRSSSAADLEDHAKTHAGDTPRFLCPVCKKTYKTEKILKWHNIHVHLNVRPYTCQVCNYSSKRRADLKLHMATHSDERPFACTTCRRSFKTRQSLNSHVKFHLNQRQFSCPMCGESFLFADVLTAHMRKHTGETPFLCDECGKGFRTHQLLASHLKFRHKHSPTQGSYKCSYCERTYGSHGHLTIHLKTHVAEEIAPNDQHQNYYSESQQPQ